MRLVNMELPKPNNSQNKASLPEPVESGYYEKYPWGLRLTLDTKALEKLGLDVSDFPTGTTVKIMAEATVIRTADEAAVEGGDNPSRSIDMQITNLAVEPAIESDFERSFNEAAGEEY